MLTGSLFIKPLEKIYIMESKSFVAPQAVRPDKIQVRGASEHNLKQIDVDIPRDQLVVITGVSGSGKSTLAFDTIYAEGQRRYLESLSSYARQFLGLRDKPAVESINGLSPVISIDQKSTARNNPRSTVATVTEIYDYLRLLYARLGTPHDPAGQPIVSLSQTEIIERVMALPSNHRLIILAPIARQQKGEFAHLPELYSRQGYSRVRVDRVIYDLDEFPVLKKQVKHDIELVVDRVKNEETNRARISSSISTALNASSGPLLVLDADDNNKLHRFSQYYTSPEFPDFIPPEMEPRTFSFNSPQGACPACSGLGQRLEVSPELVLPNSNLTINQGAFRPFRPLILKQIQAVAQDRGFSPQVPVNQLSQEARDLILHGTGQQIYSIRLGNGSNWRTTYEGIIANLQRLHKNTDSDSSRRELERYMVKNECHQCQGKRLIEAVLLVSIANKSIAETTALTVLAAQKFFSQLKWSNSAEESLAQPILAEILARLSFLVEVGLGYLTLDRTANSLSGGEAQRIRLATQIGSGLQGVIYILDEPSIGLHQRDNDRLLKTLFKLRDLGNSVLVVEHDEETIRRADYLVDVGPGAGVAGGEITAVGQPNEVAASQISVTADYLAGRKEISYPKKRRPTGKDWLTIKGARSHNLKNIEAKIPLGVLVGVSGVSGSGKSSLINDIVANELQQRLNLAQTTPGPHDSLEWTPDSLDKVVIIDQSPIGRTPRSNPATYVGLYTPIRDLMAATQEARWRGFGPGHFSFNVTGGRCEACRGDGTIKKEMHFLPDIYVVCEVCQGRRYNPEVLEVRYQGLNISEILDLSIASALDIFAKVPAVKSRLQTLFDVGLGYVSLGQPAPTLSGGEAQRVKLSKELSRRQTGKTIYILDEPTTGLHMEDVARLITILQKLVSAQNSVIVIEHNLDVLKNADYLIDLGPEGGAAGGEIVAAGRPEEVAKNKASITGQFLAKVLK